MSTFRVIPTVRGNRDEGATSLGFAPYFRLHDCEKYHVRAGFYLSKSETPRLASLDSNTSETVFILITRVFTRRTN
jgi:hypothetical protein